MKQATVPDEGSHAAVETDWMSTLGSVQKRSTVETLLSVSTNNNEQQPGRLKSVTRKVCLIHTEEEEEYSKHSSMDTLPQQK